MSEELICANCRQHFTPRWGMAEANAEAKEIWGVDDASTDARMVVVCDTCYKTMDPHDYPELVAETIRKLEH